jgi:hypothetical protein
MKKQIELTILNDSGGFISRVTGPGRRRWMATAAREGILTATKAAEMLM